MERSNDIQIKQQLEHLPEWQQSDDKWIERQYRFKEFLTGIKFVDQVAEYAEAKKHHPVISINYKKVTLRMSSWQEKGLTDLDFDMAKHFDELYQQIEA